MVFEKVAAILAEQFAVPKRSIKKATSFAEDLGADSADIAEFVLHLEEEFDLGEADESLFSGIETVGDLTAILVSLFPEMED